MNAKMKTILLVGLGSLAGTTAAQATEVYASGLLHQAVGAATLGTVDGRRLPVNNIGSSGQDGVDVQLRSAWGGGVGVQIPPTLPSGREIRIRPKGWDGTIKGRMSIVRNSDGSISATIDYTQIGAVALRTRTFNSNGQLVSDTTTTGSIQSYVDNPICPPPLIPTWWHTSGGWWVYGCGYGLDPYGNQYPYLRTVQPVMPPGVPVPTDVDAILIRGFNLPSITVVDASLETFGVSSWGLGQAHISEQCLSSTGCAPNELSLVADNIGSSGQDGVAIDLGGNAGSFTLRSKKCPDCPPGHITLIKFYDEVARTSMTSTTSHDPLTGANSINPDFSGIGASSYLLELADDGGHVMSSTLQISGIALSYYNLCGPGSYESWSWVGWPHPYWKFNGCVSYMDFVLPGGTVITGVAEARMTPIGMTSNDQLGEVAVTSNDAGSQVVVNGVVVKPPCDGDVTGDRTVDLSDLAILLSHFGLGGATRATGDLNGDGIVDLSDLAILLSHFGMSCP